MRLVPPRKRLGLVRPCLVTSLFHSAGWRSNGWSRMKPIHPDRTSERAETVAYLALGAAALAGVLLALPVSIGFGNEIDPVTARLTRENEPPGLHFVAGDRSAATNLAQGPAGSQPAGEAGVTNPALPAPVIADPAKTRSSS